MRAFLNSILAFISSESLTDDEFDTVPEELEQEYSLEVYTVLKGILEARESVSGQLKKLKAYFLAKGVDVSTPSRDPKSQIFVGASLDDC